MFHISIENTYTCILFCLTLMLVFYFILFNIGTNTYARSNFSPKTTPYHTCYPWVVKNIFIFVNVPQVNLLNFISLKYLFVVCLPWPTIRSLEHYRVNWNTSGSALSGFGFILLWSLTRLQPFSIDSELW
jgi:quinol-cytochrome oxidoreductase complex cytochrome b subunit